MRGVMVLGLTLGQVSLDPNLEIQAEEEAVVFSLRTLPMKALNSSCFAEGTSLSPK